MKKIRIIHAADIVIILLLAAIIYAAVLFAAPREVSAFAGDVTIRYTVELGGRLEEGVLRFVREGFHENIVVGEPVFDSIQGRHIGVVSAVYAMPFYTAVFNEELNIVQQVPVAGLETVRIVIEAGANISPYETLIGTFPVSVGREAYIRSKYFAGAGYIIQMAVVN